MAKVGRIKTLAPEMEKLIKESNSVENVNDCNAHNCKSGNLNLHRNVKWRSLRLLSKDALVGIIEILLKEVERSGQHEKKFPEEEKSRNVQIMNRQKTVWTSKKKEKDPEETDSWTEVSPKRFTRKHKVLNVNQVSQESLRQGTSIEKYKLRLCPYCRAKHEVGKVFCKAFDKCCRICGKKNHFAIACWFKSSQRSYETTKLQNTAEDEGTVEQFKETMKHKSLEEFAETTKEDSPKPSSVNGKIAVESSEVELCDDEQSDQVKSQNRSDISILECESKESNHAEINNVISDKDAADFVDKLLMKMNANYSSEGKEVKNGSFPKKNGKKNLCKNLKKQRDV